MKKKLAVFIAIGLCLFLCSGCFIQETLSYMQSTEDIINTVYVLGIVGFVAGWLFTHTE